MSSLKAIIFDMDGTLVDSIQDIMISMNHVLSENGFPLHDLETYRKFIGNGVAKLVERSANCAQDNSLFKKIKTEYSEYYNTHSSIYTKAFDGIEDVLAILSQKYKLAVLSNKGDNDIKALVPKYFTKVIFDATYGQHGQYEVKPNPALALLTAKELGVEPNRILFVGDSPEDIMTGKNAGMHTAGVLWGYRDYEQLKDVGCTIFCRTPADIIEISEEL